MRTDALFNPR